jgi:hypothetical protein
MIFCQSNGNILIINKCDYKNDYIYYTQIYEIMSKCINDC